MLTLTKKVILGFVLIFTSLVLPNLLAQNVIGDEPVYMTEGDRYLHAPYSFYNNSGSPHFLKTMTATLYYALPLNRNYEPYFRNTTTDVYTVGQFVYDQNSQFAQKIIVLARLPHLAIGLALGAALFIFLKKYKDTETAVYGLILYTFHPLVLAHAGTANLDLGTTALTFATLASNYILLRSEKKRKWIIITGILLGITQLTKISAVLLYPFILLVPLAFKRSWETVKNSMAIIALSILTIIALYGFQIGPVIMPHDDPAGLESLYGSIPIVKNFKTDITNILKLPIFPAGAYLNTFAYQFTHSFYGHTIYLNGAFTDKGLWYFIPVLFLYKNSIIFLVLMLITLAYIVKKRMHTDQLILYFSIWVICIVLWSVANKLQLGLRYAMPVFPALFILIAISLRALHQKYSSIWLVGGMLALYVISTLSIYPHYFTYTNELLRTQNPLLYLADSDYDWGQSVYKLGRVQKEKNIYPLYFTQFGGASQQYYKVQSVENAQDAWKSQKSGYYAFSHSALVGLKKDSPEVFEYFVNRKPQHIIDNTIYVYKISF